MGGLRTSNQVSIQAFVFVLFSTFVQNKQKKYMFLPPSCIMTNNPGLNSLHFQLICQDFALLLQWSVKFFLLFISHQVLPPTSQHIVRKQSKGCELVGHRFTHGNSTVSLFFLINGNRYNSKGNISEIILHSTRYLEFQGTVWNTSRYPYFDISDLQNWGKPNSINHI